MGVMSPTIARREAVGTGIPYRKQILGMATESQTSVRGSYNTLSCTEISRAYSEEEVSELAGTHHPCRWFALENTSQADHSDSSNERQAN